MLFTGTGTLWFNIKLREAKQTSEQFRFAGWVMAQTLMNGAALGVQIATVVFHHLMATQAGSIVYDLHLLDEFDREQGAAVRKVIGFSDLAYAEFLELEDLPHNTTRTDFVTSTVRRILSDEINWMANALRSGFFSVVRVCSLRLVVL